ncbi:MAG: transglutaminase [Acidimicrobiaceae bacterium]|nr:transglutaminase [Acidimicrobiaceae bacterium]
MGIHVGIEHRTTYRFDRPTTIHPHFVRLRPAPHSRTPILSYSLTVRPEQHFVNWQQDPFGNYLARLVFPEPARELEVTVDLVADMTVVNPFDFFVEESASSYPFEYAPDVRRDLEPYLRPATEDDPQLDRWMSGVGHRDDGTGIADFLVAINRRLYDDVEYSVRMEPGVQPPGQTLARGIGSCRDTGWLLVEALRRLGLAARFVSGYLVQLTSDQPALDGADGPTADFTDLHAWAEVYVPGAGWIGLDPTSGLFAGEGHIPLACTPHPSSAAPISGSTGPAETEFSFSNVVRRIREDPRVTLPYSADQWTSIDRLGRHVDERLTADDVRLTMGGEPTFVSIDDMEGAEWNVAADGPAKRTLARELAGRLRARFGSGGLVQHGQGKWYPGEPLPRWQIDIVWRRDGEPLWSRPDLLADPDEPGSATLDDVASFAGAVAERFGIGADGVVAAYEDPVDRAWAEARLPSGDPPVADVGNGRITDGDARAALVDRLSTDAGDPVGYVVPLHESIEGDGWGTTTWHLRRGRLYLIPGDSPIGLRLPLDSLSWAPFPATYERSPFEERDELPAPGTLPEGPADHVDRHRCPPTSIGFELRRGHVAVFLPPVEHAEHAVELLAVVDLVAAELACPVIVQGYGLPRDPRLGSLSVTPDPGVIEVNVQPTSSWDEMTDVVTTLYDEARSTRLGTEKFALDGTHTGTGGGNHVTLGGRTPVDSPLLRRPDLLRSLITYWQHHPSLSYLFAGQFIGPTSQAPRVDEGRADNVYELEIAFAELQRLIDRDGSRDDTDGDVGSGSEVGDDVVDDGDGHDRRAASALASDTPDDDPGGSAPAWMVDRLLRHLLVDLTGNTHRAEFCVDKLFSPDSERGRLGILELRAFEMPPHPQMALVQSLLVRSIVSRMWRAPYRGRLVRWGTDLYDRFMLPWFVRADIHDVIDDLRAHGLAFDEAWLAPFLEFRFPLIGETTVAGVHLELRRAIEPWHVLGEEAAAGGTARYVDSSVERLQLRVDDLLPERHVVTCNGVPVPLQPTTTPGTAVAGVRFKAWAPWSALHPTIGVHAPLVFDVVDRWSERSLGGCTYDVTHPGGRAYDTFPVNAAEAEARRATRFRRQGHQPGRVDVEHLDRVLATMPREYPRTLDLRRF